MIDIKIFLAVNGWGWVIRGIRVSIPVSGIFIDG